MLFVKLKVFLTSRSASRNLTRNSQQTTEPTTTDETLSITKRVTGCAPPRPSSLAVLANTARGDDAETLFHQMFMEDVSKNCTIEVERPIFIGTLKALAASGIRMSQLKSFLIQSREHEESSSMETFDVVIPLRLTNSQTSIAIEAPEQSQNVSETLCNNLIVLNTSHQPAPLRITNLTSEESTFVAPETPCLKLFRPTRTPILCRLTAHRSEQNLSILDFKPPHFVLPSSPRCHYSSPHCTPSSPSSPSPNPGQLTTRDFELTGVLGAGAFGTVCAARYKGTGGGVALKVIKKRVGEAKKQVTKVEDVFGPLNTDVNMKEGAAEMGSASIKNCNMVVSEWLAMQRLAGVEGVVEVLGSWHDTDNFYIAMPLYTGGTLQSRLAKCGRFSIEDSKFYISELVSGLAAIHERGIIHRDLKSANVLIGPDGHLKIADFGLSRSFEQYANEFERSILPHLADIDAKAMGRFAEVTNAGCGTAEYMAPEVYKGELYSYNVDIWALGVMAFKMIVGRSPWAGAESDEDFTRRISEGVYKIEEWEQEIYGIDEDAVLFIKRVLDKDPGTRPSASQLKGHLWLRQYGASHTSKAPWVPSASGIMCSRQGMDLDVGAVVSSSEDPIPYFNYISPKLADAPTAMPTLISSSSSSMFQMCALPPPPLMGYPYPSSASGLHHAGPNTHTEIDHEHNDAPFPAFWAAPQDSESISIFPMRLGTLNLGANPLDASPAKSDSSAEIIMRPGALNLRAHPIDCSPSRSASTSFARFWGNRIEPADVPTSVTQEPFNFVDFVSREESGSLPFVPFRPTNPLAFAFDSSSDVADSFDELWRTRREPFDVPTSVSEISFDIARLALREESASLPFVLSTKLASSSGESRLPSTLQPYGDDLQYERRSPMTSTSSLDILSLVKREESNSLPFFPSKYSPVHGPPASSSTSSKRKTWLSVLPTFHEYPAIVMEADTSCTSITPSMGKVDTPRTPLLLSDVTLYSPSTNSPDLTLFTSGVDFLTSNFLPAKVFPAKESHMALSITPITTPNSPPDLTLDNGFSFALEFSQNSTESTHPIPYPSSSPFHSTSIDSVEGREFKTAIANGECDLVLPPSFTKETSPSPMLRPPHKVSEWLRIRLRSLFSFSLFSSRVS